MWPPALWHDGSGTPDTGSPTPVTGGRQLILRLHESSPGAPLELATVPARPDWSDLLPRGESFVRATAA